MDLQGSPDAKKPCKGILKTSSSFDKHSGASHRKSAKFDELNVLQTYHPPDKDYGHMKIEEPKTPYNYVDPDLGNSDQLDAELLAEKLQVAANSRTSSNDDSSDDEEYEEETEEQRARRLEFERRRKTHYNEFEAVKLARKLIEEEDDDDDVDDDDDEDKDKDNDNAGERNENNTNKENNDDDGGDKKTDIVYDKNKMDIEIKEDAQNTSPSSEH